MLDGVMLRMVEEATHAGYPMDAAAVLLIELEGIREVVETQVEQVRAACLSSGPSSSAWRARPRSATCWERPQERVRRRGRVSPSYYVQDGVVPRTRIAATLQFIARVAASTV